MTRKQITGLVVLIAGLAMALCGCSASLQVGHAGSGGPSTQSATPQGTGSTSSTRSAPEPGTAVAPVRTHTKTVTRVAAPPAPQAVPASLREIVDTKTQLDPAPYMGGSANAYFLAPSQNIGCYMFADGGNSVQCTISHYEFDQPGPDCPNGAVVQIDEAGTPSFVSCAEAPLSSAGSLILPYGNSLTNGQFSCASAQTGVSCMDRYTGSGFTLTRQAFARYN